MRKIIVQDSNGNTWQGETETEFSEPFVNSHKHQDIDYREEQRDELFEYANTILKKLTELEKNIRLCLQGDYQFAKGTHQLKEMEVSALRTLYLIIRQEIIERGWIKEYNSR